MAAKRKLNSLEQEILLQEQITVANEINRLELEIANSHVNSVQNNRLRFWTFFFSGFIMAAIALYVLIIIAIGDLINLSFEFQKFLVICSTVLIIVMPLFNVGVWVAVSLHIRNKNAAYMRANKVMLVRLEKYYKLLKYEFDPEKYKLYDDDFVVDIDENGNLIKYIRFFNEDGSITTKPFTDIKQLRKFIDQEEIRKQEELANKRLLASMEKFEIENKKFNTFDFLDNNLNSKAVIDESNIKGTKFVRDNDFLPEQYNSKVSKWFNIGDFRDNAKFREELASQVYDNSLDDNDYSFIDTTWLREQFSTKEKGGNLFFRQYDISAKSLGKARDVQEFINVNRNFDLQKNPAINWEDTIDPKDVEKQKLATYNQAIADYEQYARDLTKYQLATEYELRHNNKRVLRVELVDDQGINVYQEVDPFKNVKQELEKQQRRIDEVNKTKAVLLDSGIENVSFEGLSVPELKKLAKIKVKQHKELLKLMKDKNVDAVVMLENNIAKIKAEKFKEIHLANERYQNIDGQWEYHDEMGNYFVCDETTNEWLPIAPAADRFEQDKEKRIIQLQKEYQEDSERQLKAQQEELDRQIDEINEIEGNIGKKSRWMSKRKKAVQKLKEQERENQEFEKEQNKEFEEMYQNKVNEYQKQFEGDGNNLVDYYVENHEPNEVFMNNVGQWMYHDGYGNYYVDDGNGNWIPGEKPKDIRQIQNEKDELLSPWEKDKKQAEQQQKEQEQAAAAGQVQTDTSQQNNNQSDVQWFYDEASGQWYDQNGNWYTGEDSSQQTQTTNNAGVNEPQQWQDENGYWWYLDEAGNYYYADENGNWIPYQ